MIDAIFFEIFQDFLTKNTFVQMFCLHAAPSLFL